MSHQAVEKLLQVQIVCVVAAVYMTACAHNTYITEEGQQMVYTSSRHDLF